MPAALDIDALSERDLPVRGAEKQACMAMLSRENCTLSAVVERIVLDPGLTVAVLRTVNRKRGANRARLAAVDSAANLLGQRQLRACIENLPELEDTCRADNLPMALMLWERQRHAVAQAAHWAHLREDKSPSECGIVAGCVGLPELMTCVYHPDAYRSVVTLQNERGSQGASVRVLGTDFAALGRHLVQRWCLPELLDDVFRPDRYEFYRPLGIMLASELARQADAGWYTARTVACLETIAEYLGWSYERCVDMVHQVAVRSARAGAVNGAVPAAARLVQLPGEVTISGVAPVRPAAPVRVHTDEQQARLQAVLLQVKQQLQGADLRTVLNVTIKALHTKFEFSRCVFFLLDKGKTTMRPRIVLGEDSHALQALEIDGGSSRVFASLLQKPQSLLVNRKNRSRYEPHMPDAFNAASADTFACMSVFADQRPIGLVYVDQHNVKPFGADQYACFKTLCGVVNQSLRVAVAQAQMQAPAPKLRRANSR